MNPKPKETFEEIARNTSEKTFLRELWSMIRFNKKYWLLPIVITLLLLGLLVFLSGTAVAPFIYTLF
jgi:hypothetical protein